MKHKLGGRLAEAERKAIFGEDIAAGEITTSFVERCGLTMRQDNRRPARKTLAFSKKAGDPDEQMMSRPADPLSQYQLFVPDMTR